MSTKTTYETGARKLHPQTGADPSDAFSRKAAENRKPDDKGGLSEDTRSVRSETDKSDFVSGSPERDAAGQSESRHAGGSNDGTTSADPRVLSKKPSGDATFPLKKPD